MNKASPCRRIMAIWLPRLAIDRWRHAEGCARGEGADGAPTVLIAETARGLRIEAANDAALAAGAAPGIMLPDARTLCPWLRTASSDPEGDRAFLERLAAWAQRWGPWSAVDEPDGLLVDVSAVSHLFGGESRLLADAQGVFARRGLATRLAIAPTAGAAWALAHHAADRAILGSGNDAAQRLGKLPVAALRLEADVLLMLRRLGLKRIGDFAGIGRDTLRRRFRGDSPSANPLLRLDQLLGRMPEPLLPVSPAHPALAQRRLPEPICHREALDRVVADLARDMARALELRGEGARRLALGLWRVDGEVLSRRLELAAATRDPEHFRRLFAARLDTVDAGFGIELAQLSADWCEPLTIAQPHLERTGGEAGVSLAVCMDRLTVRLGPGAVRRPALYRSHIPERAQRWRPPLEAETPSQESLVFHDRPLKLLDKPEKIAVLYATPDGHPRQFRWRGGLHDVVRVEGPERIAPEWWREKGSVRLRDYYRIEDAAGRRYWIYRAGLAGDGRGGLPDWFLQGLCA